MLKKLAILLAVLVPAIALAGGPVNPPGPTPITCTGGNSVVAYSGYGQPLTCGTGTATGTISTGAAGQLADYTAATTIGPITTGTGVVTALGVNVGTAGSVLVNGGVLGTPSSGTLTNATGLPIATGVSGLGANVATFLATPSSANLAAALTTATGTGLNVFNTSPSLTTPTIAGATLSGTIAGTPTISGNLTYSGRPIFTGVLTGTQVSCLGLDATNNLTVNGSPCGSGGGGGITFTDGTHTVTGSTQLTVSGGTIGGTTPNATLAITGTSAGFGVDGGTSSVSVTGTGAIGAGVRLVKIATGWVTGTLTLPAISGVSADTAIAIVDGGFLSGSATLTVAANATDTGASGGIISSGGTVSSVGAYTNAGDGLVFRVSGLHTWTVQAGSTIASSSAPANQFANAIGINGLTYAAPLGSVNGIVKANGSGAPSQAVAGTDFAAAPTGGANTPLFNNGSGGFTNGTVTGNTTAVATTTGAFTSGDCVKSDANHNLVDAGAACGTGGGGGVVTLISTIGAPAATGCSGINCFAWTGLTPSANDIYQVECHNVVAGNTSSNIQFQLGVGATPTWTTGAAAYNYAQFSTGAGGGSRGTSNGFPLFYQPAASATIHIRSASFYDLASTTVAKGYISDSRGTDSGGMQVNQNSGYDNTDAASAITAIRLIDAQGTPVSFTSGICSLFKKAG